MFPSRIGDFRDITLNSNYVDVPLITNKEDRTKQINPSPFFPYPKI